MAGVQQAEFAGIRVTETNREQHVMAADLKRERSKAVLRRGPHGAANHDERVAC